MDSDNPSFIREAYKKVGELQDLNTALARQRDDMIERIDRMTRTMEELRTSKFTIGAILMRYPGLDYNLQITHMYQTPSGQVVVVAPLPFIPSAAGDKP